MLLMRSYLLIHKCARPEPFRLSLYMCNLWKLTPVNRWRITSTKINITNMLVIKVLFVLFQFLMMVHRGSWWASVEPFLCLTEVCMYCNYHHPHYFPKLHEKLDLSFQVHYFSDHSFFKILYLSKVKYFKEIVLYFCCRIKFECWALLLQSFTAL